MGARDRHGRGPRAPILPPTVPRFRSRADAFDDLVLAGAERLARRWSDAWGDVDFAVEEVPPSDPAAWEGGVPLGRLFPAEPGLPARVVVYRRPIEQRSLGLEDRTALVRDLLAEHVAHLLDRTPEEVDPAFGT